MGEVVILNADTNTVETPFDDLESLPQDVVSFFKYNVAQAFLIHQFNPRRPYLLLVPGFHFSINAPCKLSLS